MLKQPVSGEVVTAIQTVSGGEPYLSPSVSKKVLDEFIRRGSVMTEQDSFDELTDREREVLQLVAEGHSSREIAELLCLGLKTVETHRANIMDKLGLRGTALLTQYAIRKGVVDVNPT